MRPEEPVTRRVLAMIVPTGWQRIEEGRKVGEVIGSRSRGL
jgi:hypothetical protein